MFDVNTRTLEKLVDDATGEPITMLHSRMHNPCAIAFDEDNVIITGGYYDLRSVTRFNLLTK